MLKVVRSKAILIISFKIKIHLNWLRKYFNYTYSYTVYIQIEIEIEIKQESRMTAKNDSFFNYLPRIFLSNFVLSSFIFLYSSSFFFLVVSNKRSIVLLIQSNVGICIVRIMFHIRNGYLFIFDYTDIKDQEVEWSPEKWLMNKRRTSQSSE